MATTYIKAPTGFPRRYIIISADAQGVTELGFSDSTTEQIEPDNPYIVQCITELDEYFSGKRQDFSVKLNPHGTEFQTRVWSQLSTIPFAVTWSYKDLSLKLGSANYCRAVGMANGRNPICLIIPCHRVIAHDGSMGGYSGGLDIKHWLLRHEGIM
ncbi:MAG: methylated-DNA--[protein]-cysteine S-methyltransferase [Morganella sp. (in: enterobacteria)]